MKIYKLILFILLSSCGYPDIDSVPDFKNLTLSKEESIDLCKLLNTDNKALSDCLNKIDK